MDVTRLDNPAGHALLRTATRLIAETDPTRAAIAMRRHTDDPDLAAAALGQAQLRREAVGKFTADDAARLWFTRDGLEQASRHQVADRRAHRLAAAGAGTVADLCCGLGTEAAALARAGLNVRAVDNDPPTAALARANLTALGHHDRATVRVGDARTVDLTGCDAAFADPGRRRNGRRVFDPERYSPPLSTLWQATATLPIRVCKIGPGIDHAVIPVDAEAEWVSVDGSVVEAALWRGDLATVPRRASVLRAGRVSELTGTGTRPARTGPVGDLLYEPDGAVIRAGLVAELADRIGAHLGHPDIAYLYGDTPVTTDLARCWRISDVMPFHVKQLRDLLRRRHIGRLTIRKRGADIEPDRLRRELKLKGDEETTLVVTRLDGRHVAILCDPVE